MCFNCACAYVYVRMTTSASTTAAAATTTTTATTTAAAAAATTATTSDITQPSSGADPCTVNPSPACTAVPAVSDDGTVGNDILTVVYC